MAARYCIDTSSLITAKNAMYPMENFPSVWEQFELLVKNGIFIISRLVYDEVLLGGDELTTWMKPLSTFVLPVDDDQINEMTRIVNTHSITDPTATRESADPYVIAIAKIKAIPCVNEEVVKSWAKARHTIPMVCERENIKSMKLVDAIRELGLKF